MRLTGTHPLKSARPPQRCHGGGEGKLGQLGQRKRGGKEVPGWSQAGKGQEGVLPCFGDPLRAPPGSRGLSKAPPSPRTLSRIRPGSSRPAQRPRERPSPPKVRKKVSHVFAILMPDMETICLNTLTNILNITLFY